MYREFFGLRSLPFELRPDLRFLFLTARHREALSNLQYGVSAGKGLTLLVGEAGTGKTTIIKAFLASRLGRACRCVCIDNPRLTRSEFYEMLARRLALSKDAETSKARFLLEVETAAAGRGEQGEPLVVLIVDEAQALSPELVDEVRLLTNLETERKKLVSVVLAGQPEMAERLEEPAFRALKQRVELRCELGPFNLRETAGYIAGRIRIAGGEPARVFTRDAILAIHELSNGIPRTISVMCDNALVAGFATDVRPVGVDLVRDVARDFKLGSRDLLRTAPGYSASSRLAGARSREKAAPVGASLFARSFSRALGLIRRRRVVRVG